MAVKYTMGKKTTGGGPMGPKTLTGSQGSWALGPSASSLGGATAAKVQPPPGALAPAVAPPDAAYEQTAAALARQRDTRLGAIEAQRAAGLLQYGYTQDPVTGAIAYDATNTYGQAAILKRNYDQARTGNTNNYAARGQLYAGSLQNAQDEAYRSEAQGNDTLQRALQAFLAANTSDKGETLSNFELAMADAQAGRLERIGDNPLYSPVTGEALTPDARAAAVAQMATLGDRASSPSIAARALAQKTPSTRPKVRLKAATGGMKPTTHAKAKPKSKGQTMSRKRRR